MCSGDGNLAELTHKDAKMMYSAGNCYLDLTIIENVGNFELSAIKKTI